MSHDRFFYTNVKTDTGKSRQNNEDNFIFNKIINEEFSDSVSMEATEKIKDYWLCYAVFDGMGGIDSGEIAAKIMAEECAKNLTQLDINSDYSKIDESVIKAIQEGNKRVVENSANLGICGTTATILMTDGIVFKMYHLGDCRGYVFRNNQVLKVTEDHTVAEMKRKLGFEESQITQKEYNQLTEYVGADKRCGGLRPQESDWIGFKAGDKIILCTDGLYNQCTNMGEAIQLREEGKIVDHLVENALNNGGDDNITCILISCRE